MVLGHALELVTRRLVPWLGSWRWTNFRPLCSRLRHVVARRVKPTQGVPAVRGRAELDVALDVARNSDE
ncbi:MAG: hypothetical protein QOD04_3555 [Pseudonocardiales bacterium]|nr:hypothetical protein [Pseudonocardiales bacterium]